MPMQVLGTDFKKIDLERNTFKGEIEIDKVAYNVRIINVEEREINLGTPTKVLAFECEFKTNYPLKKPKGKNLGEIEIVMDIIVHFSEQHSDILKKWKKKKMDPELMETLMNIAFELTLNEAMYLSRKVMLPPPVRTPRLKLEQEKGNAG